MAVRDFLRDGLSAARLAFGRAIPDIKRDPRFMSIMKEVDSYSLLSTERLFAVYQAVNYIARRPVEGAIVECGVWRGGSAMTAALALIENEDERDIFLFDTFAGMPEPGEADREILSGRSAEATWQTSARCYASLEEVQRNLQGTGYPEGRLHFVRGMVEETIPEQAPERIAFLRLDTDWYESTLHELEHLYPRLAPGGVLLIDDYGHWAGSKKAVDEYFEANGAVFLSRTDYSGRAAIKPA
jgi:hypothetical protein